MHRILGSSLCVLCFVWFLSGFVMIYHTFPKVSNEDKYAYIDPLEGKCQSIDSILKKLPEEAQILRFSLKSYGKKPFYETVLDDGILNIPADLTMEDNFTRSPEFADIQEYAQRWSNAEIVRIDTLTELEQWIPFSSLKKDFPIYKFYFGDSNKSQLYVSSKTGDVLQFTTKENRFWAWLGPIPHWVYFTSLRQNTELWMNVMLCLSGFGCIMCISGLILGINQYIKYYCKKRKWNTPYKKLVYKWHHILGFIFGIFALTFIFSGLMSLADVPQWLVKTTDSPSIRKQISMQQPIVFDSYKLDIQKLMDAYPQKVKIIEWSSFGNIPLYRTVIGEEQVVFDASADEIRLLNITEDMIKDWLPEIHQNKKIDISLIEEYDNYYISRRGKLGLPVYKVEIDDADHNSYYINPKNANVIHFNVNTRIRKWTYQALHSFSIKYLLDRPILWYIIMWTSMIGGTLFSFTGVWLGFGYIIRKIKKFKKVYLSIRKKG